MTLVKKETYRSEGRDLHQTDDMVRVIITMTVEEYRKFIKDNSIATLIGV